MKLTKGTVFGGAIVLQVMVILLLALFKLSVVTSGTSVLLRVAPVDPRDPFRGDYVTVQYDISSIPVRKISGPYEIPRVGSSVYVSLAQAGSIYEETALSLTPPKSGLFIAGIVKSISSDEFRVSYGIEEYFIPEGTGRTFPFGDHDVVGEVSIDKEGSAVARQLYIDGKRWP